MTLRLYTILTGLLALITAALLALAPANANPTSGGYQLFEPVASEHQVDIQLTSLGNFAPLPVTAPESSIAPNRTDGTYSGGPHRDTSQPIGDGLDSHHCPAKNFYQDAPISSADGPAVQMDSADHRLTSSYGNSAEARAYSPSVRARLACASRDAALA